MDQVTVSFEMVDFYKEHARMIAMGLAQSKPDVETKKFYRVGAEDRRLLKPGNRLVVKNARIPCQGKLMKLGCEEPVPVTNPLHPSPDGDLILNMKGVLDATSKCLAKCTCGTEYMIFADATVGEPGECDLAVVTTDQPKAARMPVTPFLDVDSVHVIVAKSKRWWEVWK